MSNIRPLLVILILVLLIPEPATAQRRRKKDEDPWPPERAYSRLFLGGALQGVFERHYDFCGFTKSEGKRDYTPPTIEKFLGQRSLRTRVEKADINGGNLLSYVFSGREITAPLDAIRYSPTNLLYNELEGVNLLPQPREGFDAFVLTKNCGGYLKSSLDAGFKPPYAAFAAALDTDAKRSSSVLAMAGSFESPLSEVLGANDARTTELMARLWQFYEAHPEYLGEAYYLRQFDGVLIKHLTDSKEVIAAEQSVGVNVSLPLTARVNSSLSHRRENENTFTGSDWETIVYTDFSGPYTREAMFYRLPGPEEIADYFAGMRPVSGVSVPLREGAAHHHTVGIPGLPAALAGAAWHLEQLTGGVYQGAPGLSVSPTDRGISFTLSGHTAPSLFRSDGNKVVTVSYVLVLPSRGSMPSIRVPVTEQLNTSAHPLVDLAGTRFELHRRNTGQYALQWHLAVNVEDRENPLDAAGRFDAQKLSIGVPGETMDARVVATSYDARRAVLNVTLETERSWPLRMIDDRNMRTFPLEAELCLPVKEGFSVCRRPITARLAVPNITAPATPAIPFIRPSPDPAQG
ncbi:hypothetical protein GGR28_000740 [Lewinella aquimaris]|uniref:Uncharacterized protein n=1 Tax=Neolewinella aquimaris TaxID=1835722 RepID=A0A840E8L7_9BACT|nr:hypothetical protein [Neolewinella aquimaris]MBB4078139.1 hypothetical protein [Neolewinella aquimaris]